MDSEYTYQPQFIWKQTTQNGLLPVTNFAEEIKEDGPRKRGRAKDTSKQLGVITVFNADGQPEERDDDESD
jgi:hypothetical protein